MALTDAVKQEIYSRSLQTQDRYVEVLTSLEPPVGVVLEKFTSFRVLGAETAIHRTIPYLKIELLSGKFKGKDAYMPRTTVHNYGRGYLPPSSQTTTGISYGGDKTPFGSVDDEHFKAAFLSDGAALRCQFCGGKRSAHRVWETDKSRQRLLELHDYLEGSKDIASFTGGMLARVAKDAAEEARRGDPTRRLGAAALKSEKELKALARTAETTATGFAGKDQVMLGVLITEASQPWAAYSGDPRDWGSSDFFREACRRLDFRPAPHVAVGDVLYGRKNRKTEVKARSTCAAVKLLQAANKASETAEAMSEGWFHPNQSKEYKYTRRQTIESCDNCRMSIPAMLCPADLLDFRLQDLGAV